MTDRSDNWQVKIGPIDREAVRRAGAGETVDTMLRDGLSDAFYVITGERPEYMFSGMGAALTESELAVVEDREPDPLKDTEHLVGEPMITGQPMYSALSNGLDVTHELDEMIDNGMCDTLQFVRDDAGEWWGYVRVNHGASSHMTWFFIPPEQQEFLSVTHTLAEAKSDAASVAYREANER